MEKRFHTAALAAVVAQAFVAGGAEAEIGSDAPIRLALNEWTGQHITTRLAGETMKKLGYDVEYVTAGYIPQVQGIMDGNITATLEIWEMTIQEHFARAVDSGGAVDLGDSGVVSSEGWIYPPYMEEVCPGLPDWEALKSCAQALATPETFPNGRLLDYPADWGPDNDERIKALGLPLVAIPAGSEGAAAAEYKAAVAAERPILMMFYGPHWLFSEQDPQWVDLPESTDACYDDPSWGSNPDAVKDCGWPTGWVRKLAWSGTKETWPDAYAFLDAYQVTNEIQEALMMQIDVDGIPEDEAISAWMDANSDIWQRWISDAGLTIN